MNTLTLSLMDPWGLPCSICDRLWIDLNSKPGPMAVFPDPHAEQRNFHASSTFSLVGLQGPRHVRPVRRGVLAPITGPLATPGAEMIDSLKMFWEKNNNTVSGRKVELVVADTSCNPDQALTQARRLAMQEKVNFMRVLIPIPSGIVRRL